MSLDAYKKSLKTTETPRAMERRVLTQITSRLDAHQAEYDAAAEGPSRLGILAGPLRSASTMKSCTSSVAPGFITFIAASNIGACISAGTPDSR